MQALQLVPGRWPQGMDGQRAQGPRRVNEQCLQQRRCPYLPSDLWSLHPSSTALRPPPPCFPASCLLQPLLLALTSLISHLLQPSPSCWSLRADPPPATPPPPIPQPGFQPPQPHPSCISPTSSFLLFRPHGPTVRASWMLGSLGWPSSLLGWSDTSKGSRNSPSPCSQLLQCPLGLSQTPVWKVGIQSVGSNPGWSPR